MSDLLIETDSIYLFHGETAVIRASSDNGLLYYKSSNNLIAAVDEKGVVTANVVGIAEISVQDGKEAKVCKIDELQPFPTACKRWGGSEH